MIYRKQRKAPREAGRGLLDILCKIVFFEILIEIFHILVFVFFKILPYNGNKSISISNVFFALLNITKLFITSGNALKETPMECLHTFPKILIRGIIVIIIQEKSCKNAKSFLIAFQSLWDIIIRCIIAELNIRMLIHKEPSVSFLHASLV